MNAFGYCDNYGSLCLGKLFYLCYKSIYVKYLFRQVNSVAAGAVKIMEKHDIECLFYAGGNDSMDTVKMLSDYAAAHNKPQRFMGFDSHFIVKIWSQIYDLILQKSFDAMHHTINFVYTQFFCRCINAGYG